MASLFRREPSIIQSLAHLNGVVSAGIEPFVAWRIWYLFSLRIHLNYLKFFRQRILTKTLFHKSFINLIDAGQ